MNTRRSLIKSAIGAAAFAALMTSPATANELQLISAPDALEKSRSGEMILLDVRTPQEWAKSGIGEGAAAINLYDPALGEKLLALVEDDRTAPIALICHSGVRSARLAHAMMGAGFTQVYSVGEGMYGSQDGPGWLKRGLALDENIPSE